MALLTAKNPRQLTDRLIAMQLAGLAKTGAQALCAAELEASHPDLKRLYGSYLQELLLGAEALQTYIHDQGWTKAFASPEEQLQLGLQHADEFIAVKA